MNNKYIDRLVDFQVKQFLNIFGAVVIEGPKYCGKTWLGRHNCKSEVLLK